jgi:hypothetical protein
MSQCYISQGQVLGCSDGIGGIKSIWVLGATGSTVPAVTSVAVTGTTGPITGITGAGTWFNYELKRNTSSLSQNVNKSFEAGTIFYEQVLTAVLYKYDQEKRNQLLVLGQNDNIKIIAQDQNDVFYYLGQDNGLYLSGGSAATGVNFSERNGFEMIWTGQEHNPANTIAASSVAALQAIFTTGGFND